MISSRIAVLVVSSLLACEAPQHAGGPSVQATGEETPAAEAVTPTPSDDEARPPVTLESLEPLAWIAGAWLGDSEGRRIEEHWTAPAGDAMFASNLVVSGGKVSSFEFLRIERADGKVVYRAWPEAKEPTDFTLVECGPGKAVFENPEHDFPQRIVYERQFDGGMVAKIEALDPNQPKTQTFSYRRVR